MFWITLNSENEIEYLDATNLEMHDGIYYIKLVDGSVREGKISDIISITVSVAVLSERE